MRLARCLRQVGTAWRTLSENGLVEFWQETSLRLGWRGTEPVETSHRGVALGTVASASPFQVSVVIPVLNGGQLLLELLGSLHRQKNCELQILLVDSGTSDGSLSSLDVYPDVTVVSLDEPFSHSVCRNRGVDMARFPLVFLTVQDATIPDDGWLSSLCTIHQQEGLTALGVGESPRHDADAFARFTIGAYQHSLGVPDGSTMIYRRLSGTRQSKVRSAVIGNVGCLYLRESLKRTPFKGTFGEDFRMGYDLLAQGRSIGITTELKVVHSHSRSPSYWLKRAYRSRQLLVEMGLNGWKPRGKASDRNEPLLALTGVFGWVAGLPDPMVALHDVSRSLSAVPLSGFGLAGLQAITTRDPDLGQWLASFEPPHTGLNRLPYYLRNTLIDLYQYILVDGSGLATRPAEVLALILQGLSYSVGAFLASVSYPGSDGEQFWAEHIERLPIRV